MFVIKKLIIFKLKRLYFIFFLFRDYNKENIFKKIYSKNYWGSDQTVSGPGSNLINTTNICIDLPKIISKYKIKKIIDAHSGVFNWMKLVVDKLVIEYLGCDIVKELIDVNKKLYCSKKVNFAELDLIK